MEKILSSELHKFLMLVGIGTITISALTVRSISKIKGGVGQYSRATLLYLLLATVLLSLITVTALPNLSVNPNTLLVILQGYFFLSGVCHLSFLRRFLDWSSEAKSFWPELSFTLLICLVGCISFVILYKVFNKNGMELYLVSSFSFFILPFFFYQALEKAVNIPQRVVKHWFYPINEKVAEPDESKIKNLLVISFEFQKHTRDTLYTNFRAKAPTDMEFAQLFYYFINDYHERHPDQKIQVVNDHGEPFGWIFYKKPKWYSLNTHYIDTQKTIYINKIKENDIIVCSRSYY